MIDHVSTYTTHFDAAKKFYDAALGALGFSCTVEMVTTWDPEFPTGRIAAYGTPQKASLWVIEKKTKHSKHHTGFTAANRKAVHSFYEAGLANGGTDDGAPGPRAHYSPAYYGGFLLDPDGNSVEASTHTPE